VGDLLQVHKNTVIKLIQESGLPAFKVGGLWRVKPAELSAWIVKAQAAEADQSPTDRP